jgi:hypothetical protein
MQKQHVSFPHVAEALIGWDKTYFAPYTKKMTPP